jgi:hypothetical protein
MKKVVKAVKNAEPKFFGWKVVEKTKEGLMSCSVGFLKVRYVTDKWAKPRMWGGPVTLFSNPYEAVGFIKKLPRPENCRVYRAEYKPTKVQSVWRYQDYNLEQKHMSELPDGTILAKEVKLLKKVF